MFAASESLQAPSLPEGTLVGQERYRLESEIGRGGYGITYRALRLEDEQVVAVKECFWSGCTRDTREVCAPDSAFQNALQAWGERVLEAAKGLEGIAHPHLASVLEAWRENNTVYIAMEWLEGATLRQHVEQSGPLGFEEALERAGELAGALGALHQHGLLHLDVKPENAVWTSRGAVLMDFDLVQPQGDTDLKTRPLALGSRIGTPGYAPPEAYGERAPQLVQSDVYSLGATLYFLLSGQTPPSAVDRAAGVALEPLPIAPHLQNALDAALQLPINERPASIAAWQKSWAPPPPPPVPEDDYSFSAHHANFAQSQMTSGVYRVVLTKSEAEFPSRCVCCFEKAEKDADITVNSPSGRRYVPGCQACLRHQRVARASANGTGWGALLSLPIVVGGVIFCVTSNSFLQLVFGLSLCLLALFVYFSSISYGALKSSRAEEMLKSSCCNLVEPVTYNFNGTVYIWRFKNVLYAQEFKKKNAAFVV
jgi:serine/threonine protein kinase